MKKSIECVYGGAAATAGRPTLPMSAGTVHEMSAGPWAGPTSGDSPLAGDLLQADDPISSNVASANQPAVDDNLFHFVDSNSHLSVALSPQTFSHHDSLTLDGLLGLEDYTPGQLQRLSDFSVAPRDLISKQAPAWCTWTNRGFSLLMFNEIPMGELDTNFLAMFKAKRPHAQHNADLVIQSLRSFPTMMLRKETFPWFIHPHSHRLSLAGAALPEALSTCMSIAQMFALRTPETRPFLWSTIRAEFRQFINEKHHMSMSQLLAALQACMIYLNSSTQTELSHPSLNWEDWIFAESQRRLVNLWFLIGCVICVKTGISCDPSLSYRNIPLPSLKSLWEAPTHSAWESEYGASHMLQASGLANLGDLIDAQQSGHLPLNAQKLDIWNAGIDNLGSLLNLVSTMV
ncbi:hypothetical protein BP6252_06063 [Coleophoma cylindrospora]|uniref:Transcription factor domain-containing protein n=1 Tax=Coleophoma cylindrospora TaxID=1849047 RepID=A0A3D8RM96_9HELO|nr:hypothetical protein BP6252_06063 [Coleophoma cylindrospora]